MTSTIPPQTPAVGPRCATLDCQWPPRVSKPKVKCCFRCASSLGNKRKWVSLPLEEVGRGSGGGGGGGCSSMETSSGGTTTSLHLDSEPNHVSADPTSPSHTLHSNRAHDSGRSKLAVASCLCSCLSSLRPPLFCSFLSVRHAFDVCCPLSMVSPVFCLPHSPHSLSILTIM